MATSFDAFISYRRSDGDHFARRLRRILQDFRPPPLLRARQSRPLKVYLDTIYEQATNDFFERVTLPALLGSRHLIVVATKDAVDRGPDRNDWIRREIEAFERGPNAGNIFAVRAAEIAAGALPGHLERRYPNIEIIDLTGLGALSFLNPTKAARLADETVKLLAPLMGFGLDDMPALRREEERRQKMKLGLAAGSATSLIVAVAGLAVFAFHSRNQALDALSRSVFATDRVIQSVSASLPAGEARSNLLASSCDLLDSLSGRTVAMPRTNALVLCAVERAESHDRLGEHDMAAQTIESAIKLAQRQFAKTASPDDALAELVARRSALMRALAGNPLGNERKSLSEFVTSSRGLTNALPFEKDLPEFAAQTLQAAAVSLTQRQMTQEAVDATAVAIEAGQTALDRGADLTAALAHVAAIALKSEIHRMRGEVEASSEARALAKKQFDTIRREDAEAQGLGERFREVSNLVGGPSKKPP